MHMNIRQTLKRCMYTKKLADTYLSTYAHMHRYTHEASSIFCLCSLLHLFLQKDIFTPILNIELHLKF